MFPGNLSIAEGASAMSDRPRSEFPGNRPMAEGASAMGDCSRSVRFYMCVSR